MHRSRFLATVLLLPTLFALPARAATLTPAQRLGKRLFFETALSDPAGQSCASCHAPSAGFTSPDDARTVPGAVVQGARAGRFGNRKPPSVAYAAFSPVFHYDKTDKTYVGGQFWDGRAATLEAQATGPLLNPQEMDNPSAKSLCVKVSRLPYAGAFKAVYGRPLSCAGAGKAGLNEIVAAIAAYERSSEVSPFTSKFDYVQKGLAHFTAEEQRGLRLFNDKKKADCAACHPSTSPTPGTPALFTDFTYDNLGLPANPDNPFRHQPASVNPFGLRWKDKGLGAQVGDPSLDGAFKVPTLRNVARLPGPGETRAYGHDGALTSLRDVVRFYNTRDVKGAGWASPEFPATMNRKELGNLGLSDADVDAIVAFLGTLTDGFDPAAGRYPK